MIVIVTKGLVSRRRYDMKYRLNVKVNKRMWKLGIVVYNTILEAQIRQEELRLVGITSKIVDEFGGKLN